jgi:hypothetical protein
LLSLLHQLLIRKRKKKKKKRKEKKKRTDLEGILGEGVSHEGWIVFTEGVFTDEVIAHATEVSFDLEARNGRHCGDLDGMVETDEA